MQIKMFNFDKKYMYIIIGLIVIWNILGRLQNPEIIANLILTLPAVIIAMTFHEYAHAFAADKLGDDTPRLQGRLTLNPLKHVEPIGFLLLLFAGIGWGRPVEINPLRFNKKISMSKGEAIVSFAGPLMNIILAIISAVLLGIILKFNLISNVNIKYAQYIIVFFMQLIYINIGLGVFNLIPLPPLDGSKILRHFLPYKAKQFFDQYQYLFYIIFIALWTLGITSIIITPVINFIGGSIMNIVYNILNIV